MTGAMSGATHDVAVHRLMSKHCNYTAALNATAAPHRQHPEHRCGSLLHVTRSVVRARHTDELRKTDEPSETGADPCRNRDFAVLLST